MKLLVCLFLFFCALVAPARAEVSWGDKGDFAFCLLSAPSGFWVGTEDQGLWRRDAGGNWKQFTVQDGLGDNSVRCLLARGAQIWAGTARGGLSIWDGANWKTIGVDDGLPSERVNDLALSDEGDVWVATEGGLCRWNDDGGWMIPNADVAHRQIVAVACARGNVWAATACDGLLKSSDRGATWTQTLGAPIQPVTVTGAGLPSSVLNDVAVDELGQVWVASDLGVAKSSDEGGSWFYLRGADWEENVGGSAAGLAPGGEDARVELLGEDWVQSLAPDGDGHIWLGFRRAGAEVRDIGSSELLGGTRFDAGRVAGPSNDWVRAILPLANGRALLARYGGGVVSVLDAEVPAPLPQTAAKLQVPGAFPVADVGAMAQLANADAPAVAGAWRMDYATQGDWVGRYGDRLAWVYELPWARQFLRDTGVALDVQLGPHRASEADEAYTYIASLRGENPRVLYNPAIGTRRMDELNDGTWQQRKYPVSWEGPGLWVSVTVPAGAHRVAIYLLNNDGHRGPARYRDYVLQLKTYAPAMRDAEAAPDLARCRVTDFWDGVYASFAVSGPGQYWVVVGRHRSNVTKFSGIFVDRVGEVAAGEIEAERPSLRGVVFQTQAVPAPDGAENGAVVAARAAWAKLDEEAALGTVAPDDWARRRELLRAAKAAGASEPLLFNWRWKLGVWASADRADFAATMAQIEAKRQESLARPGE